MKINSIVMSGNIGRDSEVRTAGQNQVVTFTMAVDNSYKDKTGWVNDSIWFKVEFWGARAEKIAEFAKKGQAVTVAGRLSNEKYQDKDGNPRETLKITANSVEPYIPFKSNNNVSTQKAQLTPSSAFDDNDALPF